MILRKLYENITSAVEEYENKDIKKAFEIITGGQFVKSKVCDEHVILNKYPHVLINTKTKKLKYPKLSSGNYVINAAGTKTMSYLVAEEFLGYKKIKGERGNTIKFKDENSFNYDVDNLIIPKKKRTGCMIKEDANGNMVEVAH